MWSCFESGACEPAVDRYPPAVVLFAARAVAGPAHGVLHLARGI